jgi:hypothetical protein
MVCFVLVLETERIEDEDENECDEEILAHTAFQTHA